MVKVNSFRAVFLDPDEAARARLKIATSSLDCFEALHGCGTFHDGLRLIQRYARVDLIFLSEKITPNKINEFIEIARRQPNCAAAVFIVIKQSASSGLSPADAVLIGADGMLCEPFSVDNLMEVVKLATKLGQERELVRNKISITLLVTDAINQLDAAAYLMARGSNPGALLKSLRDLKKKIRALPEDYNALFQNIFMKLVDKTFPMTNSLATKIYEGASARVRKKTEMKIWKEIASIQNLKLDE